MTTKEFNENELLFDELYEKTKECGRVQFIKLLMKKEREIKELRKQLKIKQDGFTSSIEDLCEYANENERLKKQLSNDHQIKMKRLQQENKKLKQKLSNGYQIENQQKEFIEYLESEIKRLEENNIYEPLQRMALATLQHVLSKCNETIGGKK